MKHQLAIIGAGQLGSRHLQSLAHTDSNIWVFDPSGQSLEVAKDRFTQMAGKATAIFSTTLESIPREIDVAIVATNSDNRLKAVVDITSNSTVKNLILEKVLFNKIDDYQKAFDIFSEKKIRAWVNCPRRTFEIYQSIKEKLNQDAPLSIEIKGGDFGMGSNSIHFLDLMSFLIGEKEIFSWDFNSVDKKIKDSKRKGFLEFNGTMFFNFLGGSSLLIHSENNSIAPLLVTISQGNTHFIVNETQKTVMTLNNEKVIQENFEIPFQSQLTAIEVNQILTQGTCRLINFKTSSHLHMYFLEGILNHLGRSKLDICPIS